MTVSEAIKARRSIRKFKPDEVPEEIILRVLDAARLAPSGCAREARKFIVIRDQRQKEKVAAAYNCWWPGPEQNWSDSDGMIKEAPVVIVACNILPEANMRYFGTESDKPVMFTNMTRQPDTPRYWDEYTKHRSDHDGEYESLGVWDLAIALDHLSLAAVEAGLGACWKAIMNERELRKVLLIPSNVQARMVMVLGYPDESPEARPRKPLEEVVCFGKYS